jgi:hypothetical protein
VRSLRFVVLWKVWKQVLHLTVWAAVFYSRSVCEFREEHFGAKDAPQRESYGFQLRLGLLGTVGALAVALLLCSTVLSVWPCLHVPDTAVLCSVAHGVSGRELVGNQASACKERRYDL